MSKVMDVIKVNELKKQDVPDKLKWEYYFDFEAHPFDHKALFDRDDVNSVVGAMVKIDTYAREWLTTNIDAKIKAQSDALNSWKPTDNPEVITTEGFEVYVEEGAVFKPRSVLGSSKAANRLYVSQGTKILGSDFYLDGDIYIGRNNIIEPGVGIKGPTIIGNDNEIRQGTYLRGDVVVGNGGTFRGELKNVMMMDKANFPHPGYLGDSICGYFTHFGNQATAANLGIFNGLLTNDKRKNLTFKIDGKIYDIGRPKLGIIMGDFSQVGCNSVADPGTFLGPYTIAYALTRLNNGFYGPREILKNKPMEHGVIEKTAMRELG